MKNSSGISKNPTRFLEMPNYLRYRGDRLPRMLFRFLPLQYLLSVSIRNLIYAGIPVIRERVCRTTYIFFKFRSYPAYRSRFMSTLVKLKMSVSCNKPVRKLQFQNRLP